MFKICAENPRPVILSTVEDAASSSEPYKVGPVEVTAPNRGLHCPVVPLMFLDLVRKLVQSICFKISYLFVYVQ